MDLVPIVAIAYDRVIGFENRLPWRLPADLRRFKEATMGHPVVMGRRTFESIGRPLPGRPNIVVTRQAGFAVPEGVRVATSPEDAFRLAAGLDRRVFVIGGERVFEAALPRAREVLATLVYHPFRGDAFFPPLGPGWHVAAREDDAGAQADGSPLRFSFVRLRRGEGDDGCALCRARRGLPAEGAGPWDEGLGRALAGLVAQAPPREGGPAGS